MQFLREFYAILKRISRNFWENFTQFLTKFHSPLRKFHAIFKRISRNFQNSFTCTQLQASNSKATSESQIGYQWVIIRHMWDNKATNGS